MSTTPAANTNLAGSTWNPGMQQDVIFVGQDNRLYDLNFYRRPGASNPWSDYDLIELGKQYRKVTAPYPVPGAANPRGGCPLVIFSAPGVRIGSQSFPSQGNLVAYITDNDTVEAMYLDTGVVPLDLTGRSKTTEGLRPKPGSPLGAWGWQRGQSEHVVYIDQNNHIRELYCNLWQGYEDWQTTDISAESGYTDIDSPRSNSPLVGNVWENQGSQHMFYIAQDNTIREIYYQGRWIGNNLSRPPTNAPAPAADSPLVAYVCEYENTEHVIYITAETGDVQELWYSLRTGWVAGNPDLTQTTGAPLPAANSALAGYSAEYEQTEHVIYVGNDGALYELYHSGGAWGTTPLNTSAGSGATPPSDGTPLTGYAFENERTHHVFYIDDGQNVHELYREGSAWYSGVVSGTLPVSL
jgi:hypothetical protein